MTAVFSVCLVLFGVVVGSFLNVVIVRVPDHVSLWSPPSRCPQCEQPIAPRDNIPIVSWLLLRGRCRNCGEPIPAGYPLVEAGNAVLWVLAGVHFGPHVIVLPYLALFSVLLALSVIDLELYLLPNKITYPSIVASLVAIPVLSFVIYDGPAVGTAIRHALIGGFGYSGFLLLISVGFQVVARRSGMGMGDVKLALLLGLWLGWIHWILALYSVILAGLIGFVVGIGVLIARRGKSEAFPFGPWLAVGCVAAILASRSLLDWYGLTVPYG